MAEIHQHTFKISKVIKTCEFGKGVAKLWTMVTEYTCSGQCTAKQSAETFEYGPEAPKWWTEDVK